MPVSGLRVVDPVFGREGGAAVSALLLKLPCLDWALLSGKSGPECVARPLRGLASVSDKSLGSCFSRIDEREMSGGRGMKLRRQFASLAASVGLIFLASRIPTWPMALIILECFTVFLACCSESSEISDEDSLRCRRTVLSSSCCTVVAPVLSSTESTPTAFEIAFSSSSLVSDQIGPCGCRPYWWAYELSNGEGGNARGVVLSTSIVCPSAFCTALSHAAGS
jgi:hypothetical protein